MIIALLFKGARIALANCKNFNIVFITLLKEIAETVGLSPEAIKKEVDTCRNNGNISKNTETLLFRQKIKSLSENRNVTKNGQTLLFQQNIKELSNLEALPNQTKVTANFQDPIRK